MLRVIDNFLDDPTFFRSSGLKLYDENNRGVDSAWPGIRSHLTGSLKKRYLYKVESTLDTKLTIKNGPYFQWVDESWVSGSWHTDMEEYTILTFLNYDAPPNTGIEIADNTGHKVNGSQYVDYINDFDFIKLPFYKSSRDWGKRYWFKKELNKFNSSSFFKNPCIVSNKFNRTVIFSRLQLHRAQNFFGKGKDARFTLISFCNPTT
jgi:hypothetical protein